MKMKYLHNPIIIIGMHRSGTSMITSMLNQLGLFIGQDLHSTDEAYFFLRRNEKILNAVNGGWSNPEAIESLLTSLELRKRLVTTLNDDIHSFHILSYLGFRYFMKYKRLEDVDFPWGWKDPRNTFTLPLWLDLFPEAKIINVYRNGIDVAQSLIVRETKRLKEVVNSKNTLKKVYNSQLSQLKETGLVLYLMNKIYANLYKINPLAKYERYNIYSVMSLEQGFQLWCKYVQKSFEHIESIKNQVYNIKYEQFLKEPKPILRELVQFCNLDLDETKINLISQDINSDRSYAFMRKKELREAYKKYKENYWMQKLGYNLEVLEES